MLKRADEITKGDWVYFPSVNGYRGFVDQYAYGVKGSKLVCYNCPPCLLVAYPHEMVEVKPLEELYPQTA